MTITLRAGQFGWDYLLEAADGRDLLIQSDWDYPAVARTFGWTPACDCGTDGTFACPKCSVDEHLASARAWLDEHLDETAEDRVTSTRPAVPLMSESYVLTGLRALIEDLPEDAPPSEHRMAQDVADLADRFAEMKRAEVLLQEAPCVRHVAEQLARSHTVLSRWKTEGYLDPAAFPQRRRPRPARGLLVAMRCRGMSPHDVALKLGLPWPWLRATRYRPTRVQGLERLAEALNVPLEVITGEEPPSEDLLHPPGHASYPHRLTPIRAQILAYVWACFCTGGVEGLPSVEAVGAAVGRSYKATYDHLVKLLESGYLATRGRGWLDQYLVSREGAATARQLAGGDAPLLHPT